MKKLLPLLLVLLVLAGCAHNDKTNETTTDTAEPQTALETVADSDEQEILLPLDGEDMTATAAPTTTRTTEAGQTTTTANADKETQNTTTTKPATQQNTTTTKPAAPQDHITTTTALASGQTQTNMSTTAASGTPKTTGANGTSTTTSAATLPTADAEKGRYELPAIPFG